jgi:hypothetical protein
VGAVPVRELRLGRELYFVIWDEDADLAAVAKGEVVEYASDWSKVRVKVVEAPQTNLIGRTSWILPDRLDEDPRSARLHYMQRARKGLREELAEARRAGDAAEEAKDVPEAPDPELARRWSELAEPWADVELLLESIDFEAGWPENQARLAKFAVLAVLRLSPALEAVLAALPDSEASRAVRAALNQGVLGSARRLVGTDAGALLDRWAELPFEEVGETSETLSALRTAVGALAEAHGLPPLAAAPTPQGA